MTFVSKLGLRKPIDTFAPRMGDLFRALRDNSSAYRVAKPTKYGFTLAGCPVFSREDFELIEANTFLDLLESHECVLDIGANVGFYSCLASSRGKHVISFEPSPRNLDFLYRNLWGNNFQDVEVLPIGLAKEPGLRRLYGFGAVASFVPGWLQANETRFTVVPVTSLDTILAGRFQGRKLLIKMDVEGFESDVLAGAERILDILPKPTWLVEVLLTDEAVPGGTNHRFAEVFETFWKHGYQCSRLNETREKVQSCDVQRWVAGGRVDIDDTGSGDTRNFLFCVP
jgi:FkbM family methyltransferase